VDVSASWDGFTADRPTWLLVGASGRFGRLVRAAWRLARPPADVLPQFRRQTEGGLAWSPLDGPGPVLERCGEGRRIDAMIVLAGIVPGRPGADFADDARIADACLAAAYAASIRRCLVASSSAIYGPGEGEPLREDDATRPAIPYGRAKLATEEVCLRWPDRGLAVTALRIGNVAGADALLGQAAVGEGSEVVLDRFPGGGGPVRSYVDPVTLADIVATLALAEDLPPVLNVAVPGDVAMAGLLDAAGLAWRWQPAPDTAVERLVLDCSRLASIHAFPPDAATPERIVAGWQEITA
jgi:nucleoside-diphosphate-sugar epimerase